MLMSVSTTRKLVDLAIENQDYSKHNINLSKTRQLIFEYILMKLKMLC